MTARHKQRVGFLSRIDYLSQGFRKGLLEAAAKVFKYEQVDFIVIAGGLVSMRDFRKRNKKLVDELIEKNKSKRVAQAGKKSEEREHVLTRQEILEDTHKALVEDIAKELADLIPVFKNDQGKALKIYLVISSVPAYDGAIGYEIAVRLHELRTDIRFWDETSGRFPIKGTNQDFWVVLPEKDPWRSKYFSTAPDRLVEDKEIQSDKGLPSLWVADCGAVSVYRPAGELSRPRVTPPGLHKLQEVTKFENQIGVMIVEFNGDSNSQPRVTIYSFKDLTSKERSHFPIPEKATERQREILRVVQNRPVTIGMLEDALPFGRDTIEKEIKAYEESGLQPAITQDRVGGKGKYDIESRWLQRKLRFGLPSLEGLKEDSVLAFGCLHAGYRKTQYDFFANRVPQLILENDIKCLVGAGDFIAGLKHNLHLRGEVYAGFNYNIQEELAADLVASVILKVFRARLEKKISSLGKKPTPQAIERLVRDALLLFYYIEGNHDKWVLDLGMEPLSIFILHLKRELENGIYGELAKYKLTFGNVQEVVSAHIIYGRESTLPSGITLSMRHQEMGRMTTSSGRAQQTLADTNGKVLIFANFHVGIQVLQWEEERGQRLALQAGTLVSGTDFEDGKNKTVDTGVVVAKIYSHEGRIFKTSVFFDNAPEDGLTELPDGSSIKGELLKSLSI